MKKARTVLNYLFYSFALAAFGFMLLGAGDAFYATNNLTGSARTYAIWICIIDFLATTAAITLSIIGISQITAKKSDNRKLNFIYIIYLILGVSFLLERHLLNKSLAASTNGNTTIGLGLPGFLIVVSIVASVLALCFNGKSIAKGKHIAGIVASFPLFVISMLNLFSETTGAALTALSNFCLLLLSTSAIALSILYLIPCEEDVLEISAAPANENVAKLKDLKELLDAGVISKEAFDEKVKKYVDTL